MSKQRSGVADHSRGRQPRRQYSRRGVLRWVGAAVTGGVAGCTAAGRGEDPVTILAAGSLQHALETGLAPDLGVPVRIESHGSATVARLVAEGQRDPDIVTVADAALFDGPLSPSWYSVFASNAVVLAYNPDTAGGRRIAEAGPERWYEPLLAGEASLGRTDPDQDPLGYRALFVLELASRYYDDAPALRERIPEREQIYPETGLISAFETGAIDAALAYRNMAVERDYAYVEFPDQIDLGDPAHAGDWYRTVSYTLPGRRTVRGGVVDYASTTRTSREAVRNVFTAHTTGEYLADAGFVLPERLPTYEGSVPEAVRATTDPGSERDANAPSESRAAD